MSRDSIQTREVRGNWSKTVLGRDVQNRLKQVADIRRNARALPIASEAYEHLEEHLSYIDCMIADFGSNGCTVHVFARSDAVVTICFIDQFCAASIQEPRLFESTTYLTRTNLSVNICLQIESTVN